MRGLVAAGLTLCAASGLAATSATAAEPAAAAGTAGNVSVTPVDGRDYQQPSLALDPANAAHLVLAFQDGDAHQLCGLGRSSDGGRTWSARSLVGAGGVFQVPEGFAACWNPSVAFGTGGAVYYLFQTSLLPSNPYSHVMLAVSHDGGATFDPPRAVDPTSPVYPGKRAGGDWWPQMVVDRVRGVLYVTWSRFTPELDSSWILVAASRDGAQTFSTPLRLNGPLEHDVSGSQAAVQPDGTLFVAWFDYTQSERGLVDCTDRLYTVCPDWGVSTFGLDTQQMDAGLLGFYRDEGSRLDFTQGLGCEGYVSPSLLTSANYYTHIERGGDCRNPGVVGVATSADGGRTAHELSSPGTPVDIGCANFGANALPPLPPTHACSPSHYSVYDHNLVAVAAAGASGELLSAWWDSQGSMAEAPSRVSVSLSTDGGRRWRTSVAVGAAGHADDLQHRPALATAPDGRLDVVYYDLTPGGAQDVYAVSAETPRRDFSAPQRLSSRASNAAVGPMSDDNRAGFGDHLAAVSTDQAILAAWTDARGPHQAIEFARVAPLLASGSSSHATWPVAATAGAVLAALTLAAGAGAVWLARVRREGERPRAAVAAGSDDGRREASRHDDPHEEPQ